MREPAISGHTHTNTYTHREWPSYARAYGYFGFGSQEIGKKLSPHSLRLRFLPLPLPLLLPLSKTTRYLGVVTLKINNQHTLTVRDQAMPLVLSFIQPEP